MDETPKTQVPQWLLSRDGKKYGPMTSGQLKQLCKTGKIGPADLICRAGSDRWTPAGEVQGLFVQVPQTPEVAAEAPVRPIEEATASASNSADSYWKTVGSFFCLANLAACGAFGLIKSPPAMVQAMDSVRDSTRRVQGELKNLNEELRKTENEIQERTKKHGINIPSIPRIPGIP